MYQLVEEQTERCGEQLTTFVGGWGQLRWWLTVLFLLPRTGLKQSSSKSLACVTKIAH